MRIAVLLSALLVAACATPPAPLPRAVSEVHPRFSVLRPAMVALRAEEPLREHLYRGLIEKDYSVLAPGAAAGRETGEFQVTAAGPDVRVTFSDPFGTVIYRARSTAPAAVEAAAGIAAALLRDLPRK